MVLINLCYCYPLAPLKGSCRDWFLLVGIIVIFWFHWSFRLLIFCFMSEASGGICCHRFISRRLCTLVYFYHFIYKPNRRRTPSPGRVSFISWMNRIRFWWSIRKIVLLTPWLQRSEWGKAHILFYWLLKESLAVQLPTCIEMGESKSCLRNAVSFSSRAVWFGFSSRVVSSSVKETNKGQSRDGPITSCPCILDHCDLY